MSVCDFLIGNISKPFLLHRVYFSSGWTLLYPLLPLLFFSNNDLLILPIYGLQGFISRHVGLFLKFSLWSLRILKDSLSASVLMRSAKSSKHVWKLKNKKYQLQHQIRGLQKNEAIRTK